MVEPAIRTIKQRLSRCALWIGWATLLSLPVIGLAYANKAVRSYFETWVIIDERVDLSRGGLSLVTITKHQKSHVFTMPRYVIALRNEVGGGDLPLFTVDQGFQEPNVAPWVVSKYSDRVIYQSHNEQLAISLPELRVRVVADAKGEDAHSSSTADRNAVIDPLEFIESLANKNPPPRLKEMPGYAAALFDPQYDWVEYERVWNQLRLLASRAELVWPELVKHLDDDRYCITVRSATSDMALTFTIGDVCQSVVSDAISEAYQQNLPAVKSIYQRFRRPTVALDKKALRAWCEERKFKKLYELQIEMCNWAIEAIKSAKNLRGSTDLHRADWISAIETQAEDLKQTESPVTCHWFEGEAFDPYSASTAAESRERYFEK